MLRQHARGYLIALGIIAAALLIRVPLYPLLGGQRPYLTLFGAIALVVWFARWKPAVVATAVGFLAANYFLAGPRNSLGLFEVELAIFAVSTGLIIFSGEAMHLARERAEHEAAERMRAEQQERIRKELLRVTLASIGDGVISTDTQGRITSINAVAESLTGWNSAEAVGQPLEVVFHIVNEFDRGTVDNPATRVLREGVIVGLANHTILIAKDHTERAIDDSAAPIRDERGQVLGCVLVFREITARRTAEREQRRSEERLRSVVNTVIDGIITIDERGTIEEFNPAAEHLFGFPATEVVGQNVKILMPEPYHAGHDGYLANYLRTGEAKIIGIGREVLGQRKDGSTFPAELAVSEFSLAGRRYFTGVVRDITDRKQAHDALQEADRRKNVFLATLAHELRNPLAPIRNSIAVLKAEGPAEPLLMWCRDVIDRQARHMSRLLDDLLDIGRITRNKLELRREQIELAAVIEAAIEASQPAIDEHHHELSVTVPKEPIWLDADPVRLAQVLMNLLNNSTKYTDPGGRISLSAERQGSDAVVTVTDNGIGISADMLPRIFEMFSQAAPAFDRAQGGLGIGLALIKALVEMHGGSINATSEGLGKGSRFEVRLPVVLGAVVQMHPKVEEIEPASVPRHRILIADDNQDGADSLARLLRLYGHEVHVVYDGEAALAAASEFRPEVALFDIGMPKLSGDQAARRLRALPFGQKIMLIALTGWGREEDRRMTLEAGFDHHLTKPVDVNELNKLLAESQTAVRGVSS